MKFFLADEAATLALAQRLYRGLRPGCLIFLRGDLGAGKTTFVRGCLRASGFTAAVKSPTFTLVEEYQLRIADKGHRYADPPFLPAGEPLPPHLVSMSEVDTLQQILDFLAVHGTSTPFLTRQSPERTLL